MGDDKYLRICGDDGFFVRLLVKEFDRKNTESEEDWDDFDPIKYLEDKTITG